MDELLRMQAGTVSRRQLENAGLRPHDIARLVRRRELTRLLPGVFVGHTGDPTWLQRAWAGCLYYAPAALADLSALRAAAGPGWRHHDDGGPVLLAVDAFRRCEDLPGYRVRRVTALGVKTHWNTSPPRMRVEEAALDAASRIDSKLEVVGLLADICQSRRTTALRIIDAAAARTRLSDRAWLVGVLGDLADGTCSVLEHGYLIRVERPHGLPCSTRQSAGTSLLGGVARDVDYAPIPVLVELDGRLFHDSARQRDRDLDRDLDAAVDRRDTVRLGWGQVYERPCQTAARLGALLRARGWSGQVRRCGPDCAA
jgi:putative AbiEi antitoxin of type IV toxin-antitoxin system